jgi:hypothetical protein
MYELYTALLSSPNFVFAMKVLYNAAFVLVPIGIGSLVVEFFIDYKRALYFQKQTYVLLEIKVPRDVFKSPKAAEFFISGMRKTDYERNWHEKYLKGQSRQDFSLEIASIDGAIHFYIRTRKGQQNIIEANIYSQYPGVEIHEVPDYTLPMVFDPKTRGLSAFEFNLSKSDAYPIKTYVDYGMDKDPKEEFKIDPLTPLIEYMASLGRGHQAWVQILLRAHGEGSKLKEEIMVGGDKQLVVTDKKLGKAITDEIKKIQDAGKGEIDKDTGKVIPGSQRFLNDVETETIKALGRKASKTAFDVGIRILYTAPKDIFTGGNIGGMVGGITHFNSPNLNGFAPTRGIGDISEFWKIFGLAIPRKEKDRDIERQEMLDAYKRRSYFFKPHKRPSHLVLNAEELATLFHFPGGVSTTPTFTRIDSKKGEAPANIPT